LRQLAIYCSVPTAWHLKSGPVVCLNRFIGEARDDAQAVEVQQFSRQTTTYGLGLGNCLILIRCTNHHSRMSRPFSSKTKSRYRFMAAQSKNAGLTSLKTPYPRNPIQAAARPATGQTRLKNEIDCATISRSEAKIRGGIATTCAFCIFTVVLPGLWGKRVRYRTLGLPASSNLYKKARPCGPALGPNRLGERPAQHEGEKNGAGHW
jgi:hypothetical protein